MGFQYRFATILQLRRLQRDEAGAAVAQVREAIRRVGEQIQQLQQERLLIHASSRHQRLGTVAVDGLLLQGRYDLQLQVQLQALGITRDELMQESQRRQHALVAAEAEVKRYERLEEQDRMVFQKEFRRREQAVSDDMTSCRYTINRRG